MPEIILDFNNEKFYDKDQHVEGKKIITIVLTTALNNFNRKLKMKSLCPFKSEKRNECACACLCLFTLDMHAYVTKQFIL